MFFIDRIVFSLLSQFFYCLDSVNTIDYIQFNSVVQIREWWWKLCPTQALAITTSYHQDPTIPHLMCCSTWCCVSLTLKVPQTLQITFNLTNPFLTPKHVTGRASDKQLNSERSSLHYWWMLHKWWQTMLLNNCTIHCRLATAANGVTWPPSLPAMVVECVKHVLREARAACPTTRIQNQ